MMSSGETAEYSAAAPKGNAEALRQKGRTRTTLRKVRLRTPKVQPARSLGQGISQVINGGTKLKREFCVSFLMLNFNIFYKIH